MIVILGLLTIAIVFGISINDLLVFKPLYVLNLFHLPAWLAWLGIGGAIAWLIGND